jgi:hypothetical protein
MLPWTLGFLALALGTGWYLSAVRRVNASELTRIRELESEQSGGDSAALRAVLASLPPEKVKAELTVRVAVLRESSYVLRNDMMAASGWVTPEQERALDHLRRHAAELESLAEHVGSKPAVDEGRLDLYRQAVLTYGAASSVARETRKEIGLPESR